MSEKGVSSQVLTTDSSTSCFEFLDIHVRGVQKWWSFGKYV